MMLVQTRDSSCRCPYSKDPNRSMLRSLMVPDFFLTSTILSQISLTTPDASICMIGDKRHVLEGSGAQNS